VENGKTVYSVTAIERGHLRMENGKTVNSVTAIELGFYFNLVAVLSQ